MFVYPERYPFDYAGTYFVQHFEQQMLEQLQSGRMVEFVQFYRDNSRKVW